MTEFPPGLSWIQWCLWISGQPIVPTEELVFPLVHASGGRLVPAPRQGITSGAGSQWGLTDEEEQLCVLIGNERIEVREIFVGGTSAKDSANESLAKVLEGTQPLATTLIEFLGSLDTIKISAIALVCGIWVEDVALSSILIPPCLLNNAERAEIGTCRTLTIPSSDLICNRWLRVRQGSTVEQKKGLWLEVDVNTLEHPLPSSNDLTWADCLVNSAFLLKEGIVQLESLK